MISISKSHNPELVDIYFQPPVINYKEVLELEIVMCNQTTFISYYEHIIGHNKSFDSGVNSDHILLDSSAEDVEPTIRLNEETTSMLEVENLSLIPEEILQSISFPVVEIAPKLKQYVYNNQNSITVETASNFPQINREITNDFQQKALMCHETVACQQNMNFMADEMTEHKKNVTLFDENQLHIVKKKLEIKKSTSFAQENNLITNEMIDPIPDLRYITAASPVLGKKQDITSTTASFDVSNPNSVNLVSFSKINSNFGSTLLADTMLKDEIQYFTNDENDLPIPTSTFGMTRNFNISPIRNKAIILSASTTSATLSRMLPITIEQKLENNTYILTEKPCFYDKTHASMFDSNVEPVEEIEEIFISDDENDSNLSTSTIETTLSMNETTIKLDDSVHTYRAYAYIAPNIIKAPIAEHEWDAQVQAISEMQHSDGASVLLVSDSSVEVIPEGDQMQFVDDNTGSLLLTETTRTSLSKIIQPLPEEAEGIAILPALPAITKLDTYVQETNENVQDIKIKQRNTETFANQEQIHNDHLNKGTHISTESFGNIDQFKNDIFVTQDNPLLLSALLADISSEVENIPLPDHVQTSLLTNLMSDSPRKLHKICIIDEPKTSILSESMTEVATNRKQVSTEAQETVATSFDLQELSFIDDDFTIPTEKMTEIENTFGTKDKSSFYLSDMTLEIKSSNVKQLKTAELTIDNSASCKQERSLVDEKRFNTSSSLIIKAIPLVGKISIVKEQSSIISPSLVEKTLTNVNQESLIQTETHQLISKLKDTREAGKTSLASQNKSIVLSDEIMTTTNCLKFETVAPSSLSSSNSIFKACIIDETLHTKTPAIKKKDVLISFSSSTEPVTDIHAENSNPSPLGLYYDHAKITKHINKLTECFNMFENALDECMYMEKPAFAQPLYISIKHRLTKEIKRRCIKEMTEHIPSTKILLNHLINEVNLHPVRLGCSKYNLILNDFTHLVNCIVTRTKAKLKDALTDAEQCHILLMVDECLKQLSMDFFNQKIMIFLGSERMNQGFSEARDWYQLMALRLIVATLILDWIHHLSFSAKLLERNSRFMSILENMLITFHLKSCNSNETKYINPELSIVEIEKQEPNKLSIPKSILLTTECDQLLIQLKIFQENCNLTYSDTCALLQNENNEDDLSAINKLRGGVVGCREITSLKEKHAKECYTRLKRTIPMHSDLVHGNSSHQRSMRFWNHVSTEKLGDGDATHFPHKLISSYASFLVMRRSYFVQQSKHVLGTTRRLIGSISDLKTRLSDMKLPSDRDVLKLIFSDAEALCTCPDRFCIQSVSEFQYKFGKSKIAYLVRFFNRHVMVRVGGGWVEFHAFLQMHDPCRRHNKG